MENGGLKEKKGFALENLLIFDTPGERGEKSALAGRRGGITDVEMGVGCLETGLGAVDCGRQGLIWF